MEVDIMKKLYMILLTMMMTMMFVISPLYATETVEAATATYTTEKDSNKIYFPWNGRAEDKINLPLDYKYGTVVGKNYYSTYPIISKTSVNPKVSITFNKTIVDVKTSVSEEGTVLAIRPKKVGKTTVKVKFVKEGFNTYTKSIVVSVTKKKTKLSSVLGKGTNVYENEYKKTESGILKENTKLFLAEINAERQSIKLMDYAKGSKYRYTVLNETNKLLNNTSEDYDVLPSIKLDKVLGEVVTQRFEQLLKKGKLDNHEGFEEIVRKSDKFDEYILHEVLNLVGGYSSPRGLVESYKGSRQHWSRLIEANSNIAGTVCFKTTSGSTINVTISGYEVPEDIGDEILELDFKYEHLMTPEERNYYGVD